MNREYIVKCQNRKCPSSDKCERALRIPSCFKQVFVEFTPDEGTDKCIYFIKPKDDKR